MVVVVKGLVLGNPLQWITTNHLIRCSPQQGIMTNHLIRCNPMHGMMTNQLIGRNPLQGIMTNHLIGRNPLQGIVPNHLIRCKPLEGIASVAFFRWYWLQTSHSINFNNSDFFKNSLLNLLLFFCPSPYIRWRLLHQKIGDSYRHYSVHQKYK